MLSGGVEKIILAAMTRDLVIGANGGLPWHIPEELRLFRELTWGHSLILGRRTFEAIGGPLPGRRNIVLSRTLARQPGIEVCRSLETALAIAAAGMSRLFFIGGGEIYRQALPLADRLQISWIRGDYSGQEYFPPINGRDWQVLSVSDRGPFRHVSYRRSTTSPPGGKNQ